ncbi:hypothetical protein L3Y34_014611 [Caenorhabditis briggsae]|uniref:Uncharacterized protein n=1 Tax=Caenorhabditis briggsae TaxID=6238 RepID=A0AAE9IXU6_CAEBR|nr:hypothetical protein L3Y34_014611 [Caenorhabditis briggsae]
MSSPTSSPTPIFTLAIRRPVMCVRWQSTHHNRQGPNEEETGHETNKMVWRDGGGNIHYPPTYTLSAS